MAGFKVLNDVYLMIGGESTQYKANTIKMTFGAGEGKTRGVQTGGGKAKALHSTDGSTRIGKMEGSFESEYAIKVRIKQLLEDRNAGIVTAVQLVLATDGEPDILKNCQLKNDPVISFSSDGEIPFVFEGDPMV